MGIIYPLWSLYLFKFQPHEYDEPILRFTVGAVAVSTPLVQKMFPRLRTKSALLALFPFLFMTLHFNWLIYKNSLSDIYMFGAAVIAAGSSVMFERIRYYAIYSAVTVSLAFLIAVLLSGSTPKASMFFVMILTIQTVVYVSLSARFKTLQELKDTREINLEMRKQLLEGELAQAKNEREHFKQVSLQDTVTGLPNRLYIERQIHLALDRYFQENIPFTILFIDLDKFKYVNDTFGHEAGDKVLFEAGQRLRSCLRRSDIVARLGGDEFVVLMAGVDDPQFVDQITRALVEKMSAPIKISEATCEIGASIGPAFCPRESTSFEELIKFADQRMYRIKRDRKLAKQTVA